MKRKICQPSFEKFVEKIFSNFQNKISKFFNKKAIKCEEPKKIGKNNRTKQSCNGWIGMEMNHA